MTIGPRARSSSVNATGFSPHGGVRDQPPLRIATTGQQFRHPADEAVHRKPLNSLFDRALSHDTCSSRARGRTELRFGNVPELTELSFGMARRRIPAEERRIRILEAAVEVFAGLGYDAAKMQDIAGRAGVVPSVLYDHFGSKRELFITALEQHAARLRERSLRRLDGASPEDLVRESVANYFEFVEDDPFLFRFLHRDPPADPEIAAVCQELADRGTAGIADLIRFGAADAKSVKGISVDDGAWILARATQSACGGVATWWYEHRDVPRERVVELVFMLLWQGFDGMLKQASAG